MVKESINLTNIDMNGINFHLFDFANYINSNCRKETEILFKGGDGEEENKCPAFRLAGMGFFSINH